MRIFSLTLGDHYPSRFHRLSISSVMGPLERPKKPGETAELLIAYDKLASRHIAPAIFGSKKRIVNLVHELFHLLSPSVTLRCRKSSI